MRSRPEQTATPCPEGLAFASLLVAVVAFLAAGCASTGARYSLDPIKTSDPDRQPLEDAPAQTDESQYWDRVYLSTFFQLEKPLDLAWTGRQIGQAFDVAAEKEADNVNARGEPPNSSWYTRRHFYDEMTPTELARGPNTAGGPDKSAPWTIVSGKMTGATGGFVIEDARSDRYLLKFDGRTYPEATSAAEVISTKIFYAAGYHVPENYVTYFDPERLAIGAEAEVRTEDGGERPMTRRDVAAILENRPRDAQGRVRALASQYVEGRPLGPWNFWGTREGDPNDRVKHQHRRELRGMRVISAWLNDADRRAANTLASFMEDQYVRHYVLDFGSTLGANGTSIHDPIHGQAYMIDPRYIALGTAALGGWERPWAYGVDEAPRYPSVGYYRADVFQPSGWVMTYPNPAFQRMTVRDAFWGAKMVTSFTDEDLRAIVETAKMSNPEAESYLLDVLKKRRDRTGRYWFAKVNPLDRFRVAEERAAQRPLRAGTGGESNAPAAPLELRFDDLMVEAGLAPAGEARYAYVLHHEGAQLARGVADEPAVPLAAEGEAPTLRERLAGRSGEGRVVRVTLRTRRAEGEESRAVRAWVHFPEGETPRIAGTWRAVPQ